MSVQCISNERSIARRLFKNNRKKNTADNEPQNYVLDTNTGNTKIKKKKKLYTKTMKNNHSHFLVQRNFKVVKMIQLQIFKLANIK